jgi:superfamily II DNA or RNA helicase
LFNDFVKEQEASDFLAGKTTFLESEIWSKLYPFQKDGVKSAINKLQNFGGCIIADSVGLGKTFEALAIIKYFESLNQRVLVLCPKKLRENWTIYQAAKMSNLNPLERDRFQYNVLYHTDVNRYKGKSEADGIDFNTFNWAAFDLVVIDESHNFRGAPTMEELRDNPGTFKMNRAMSLMERIIKQGSKTKVLLLSATPVNNTLSDLRNQVKLITHGSEILASDEVCITGISDMLKLAQSRFTTWADPKKTANRRVKDLIESLGPDFTRLLDTITIARSRRHIERYYNVGDIGNFPERVLPLAAYPEIDLLKRFPSYDVISDRIDTYQFRLYNPFRYLKSDELRQHYEAIANKSGIKSFTQDKRERLLISMMKVGYLKRLESSIESFQISMDRTLKKIETLEQKIAHFKKTKSDEEIEADIDESINPDAPSTEDPDGEIGSRLKYRLTHLDLDRWLADLQVDKAALADLYNIAMAVTPERDAKMEELRRLIQSKLKNPLNKGNKKVIVFTAFADTAEYLYHSLKDWASGDLGMHTALVAGTHYKNTLDPKNSDFNTILTYFSPRSKGRNKLRHMKQDDEIDLLIATDCIAEGQNLQDCDFLVNYDIHWNPVRIIQRFGRIDRLNSMNEKIQLVNFWPTADLNKYINLKDRVEARMALVDLTATAEDDLLRNTQGLDDIIGQDLKYRDQQLLRMRNEVLDMDDLQDTVSLTDFTLDDFRAELQHYFNEETKRRLEDAPAGLYAVVPSPSGPHAHLSKPESFNIDAQAIVKPGIIFCLRRNDDIEGTEKLNPLHPYYLMYVQDDGVIRFRFGNSRTILEIFRLLCQWAKEPYYDLCKLFNQETNNGEDMSREFGLLKQALASIRSTLKKNNLSQLTSGRRDAQLVTGGIELNNEDLEEDTTFTLITWLVIK